MIERDPFDRIPPDPEQRWAVWIDVVTDWGDDMEERESLGVPAGHGPAVVSPGSSSSGAVSGSAASGRGRSSKDWPEIFREDAPRLVKLGRRRFDLSREDCEDALQAAAVRILQSTAVIRDRGAYFAVTYLNELRSTIRRRVKVLAVGGEAEPEGVDESAAALDDCIAVTQALNAVSPVCREILIRWGGEGYSAVETARELGLSQVTIGKRLDRCVKRFTRVLAA